MTHFKHVLSIFSLSMKEVSLLIKIDAPSYRFLTERCSNKESVMLNFIYSASQPLGLLPWSQQTQPMSCCLNVSKRGLEWIEWAEKIQRLVIENVTLSSKKNLFPFCSGGNERGRGKMKLRS